MSKISKTALVATLPGHDNIKISFPAYESKLVPGEAVTVGLRPQNFSEKGALTFKLKVELIEHLGGESFVYAANSDGDLITVATQTGRNLNSGQNFEAHFDPVKALLFDTAGERVR